MNDWRQLEVFRAVAVSASFTQAAAQLHVSQPVISRTVRDLERSLGVSLFDRTTRSVRLTPEGSELLAVAADLLDRTDNAMERFASYCRGDRGSIVIAALPSVAAGLLPTILATYLDSHPDIRFHILDVTTTEATQHVLTGKADFAIAEPPPMHPALDVDVLVRDRVVAVFPQGHHLAEREMVTWRTLAEQPFVAMSEDSSVRRLTDLAFAQAGVEPTTLVEARNIATAGGMIAAGLGVSALPELVLPLLAFAAVVTRELREPTVGRELAALTRVGAPISPPARQFLEVLRSPETWS